MSRIQRALDVEDLETAVAFDAKPFGARPAKREPGYADFALAEPPLKLVLIENLDRLGVEADTGEHVRRETARLAAEGLIAFEEDGATCCYAAQDKAWATAPDGEHWEIDAVLAHAEAFGAAPDLLAEQPASACCSGNAR